MYLIWLLLSGAFFSSRYDAIRQASARRESCYICALFTLVTMAITVSICIFLYLVDVVSSPISTVIIYVNQEAIKAP
ncbi:hypothetical protein MRX96_053025 [Rhipicephalus microplus]